MKHILYSFIISCFLFSACKSASERVREDDNYSKPMVVAYLPTWKMPYTMPWDKITHVCLAFGIVQPDGGLNIEEVSKHSYIIEEAHANNVKVLLSIGGGGSKNFSEAILNPSSRAILVDNLYQAIKNLNLDGIDMDYEEWDGGEGGAAQADLLRREALETTYRKLRKKTGDKYLITAAVNAGWDNGGWGVYNCFNNTMHQYLDFVSLMIYDETGPWSGTRVGAHSGWDFFEKAIDHWIENRKLPKEKLVVGVPFYGYLFESPVSAEGARGMGYREILKNYPDAQPHLHDSIGLLYYDGIPTIERKTQYVKDHGLGGIMFWEITQDTDDVEKSLLNTIDRILWK